jgi:hypothetical protein
MMSKSEIVEPTFSIVLITIVETSSYTLFDKKIAFFYL